MLRIITLNLNGIRSALAKGFTQWLARQRPDVVCLQEIKAQEADLAGLSLVPKGYHGYYDCCSTKKGYSGVALYSRAKPESVSCGLAAASSTPREGSFGRTSAGFPWCRCTCLRGRARRRGSRRNSGFSKNSCRCSRN